MSKQKKQANLEPPAFGADVPPHEGDTAAEAGKQAKDDQPSEEVKQTYRISVQGVYPLVKNEAKGTYQRSEYLEVQASSETAALEQFAQYNGIPFVTDTLTGQKRLASIHRAKVELVK